ncbi:hypothetical protein Tco_0077842 [Tanacetum coccineum]
MSPYADISKLKSNCSDGLWVNDIHPDIDRVPKILLSRDKNSRDENVTWRNGMHHGMNGWWYVVPTGKDNFIVSAGRPDMVPAGRTIVSPGSIIFGPGG